MQNGSSHTRRVWHIGGWLEEQFQLLSADQRECILAIIAGEKQANECGELSTPLSIDEAIRNANDQAQGLIKEHLYRLHLPEEARGEAIDQESAEQVLTKRVKAQIGCASTAIYEALTNAFRHGNRCDPRELFTMEVILEEQPETIGLTVVIRNACREAFHPEAVPDPTLGENRFQLHGHGLFQMHRFMDSVVFEDRGMRGQLGSSVVMKREISKPKRLEMGSSGQQRQTNCRVRYAS